MVRNRVRDGFDFEFLALSVSIIQNYSSTQH